ncbi:MAG: hypothetical protein ACRENO_05440 [Thermodesulfobacteriota bacterium]
MPVIFVTQVLDEWDFWAGTIGVVIFGLVEIIMFMWVFGSEKAWKEINRSNLLKIPKIFYYIMKYITPLFLIIVICWWGYEFLPSNLEKASWNIWFARIYLIILFIVLTIMVFFSDHKRRKS